MTISRLRATCFMGDAMLGNCLRLRGENVTTDIQVRDAGRLNTCRSGRGLEGWIDGWLAGWLAGGCWWWFRWSGCAYREVKEKDGGGGVSPKVARVGACSAGFSVFGFVGFVRSLQTMPPTVFSFPDCYQRALRGGWRLLSSISRDYLSLFRFHSHSLFSPFFLSFLLPLPRSPGLHAGHF